MYTDKAKKKINYMFLRHRPSHLQPPASKIFIALPVFTLKNRLFFVNCQFESVGHYLKPFCWLVGWLVDNQPVAAQTKSQKFIGIIWIHHFCKPLYKKSEKLLSHINFRKKCLRNILLNFCCLMIHIFCIYFILFLYGLEQMCILIYKSRCEIQVLCYRDQYKAQTNYILGHISRAPST